MDKGIKYPLKTMRLHKVVIKAANNCKYKCFYYVSKTYGDMALFENSNSKEGEKGSELVKKQNREPHIKEKTGRGGCSLAVRHLSWDLIFDQIDHIIGPSQEMVEVPQKVLEMAKKYADDLHDVGLENLYLTPFGNLIGGIALFFEVTYPDWKEIYKPLLMANASLYGKIKEKYIPQRYATLSAEERIRIYLHFKSPESDICEVLERFAFVDDDNLKTAIKIKY